MPFSIFGLFDRGQSVKLVEEIPSGTKVIGGVTGIMGVTGAVTGIVSAGWPIGVTGQVTAHGTITAHVGEVTAHGVITGVVSAGWPIGVTGQVTAYGILGVTGGPVGVTGGPIGVTGGLVGVTGDVTARGTITAVASAGWPIGVTGQVTAHGTITAEVKGTITAEVKGALTAIVSAGWPIGVTGQVTAHGEITGHGTVTAEAKGTVTAEVKGTLTAAVNNVVTAETRGFITAQVSAGWPVGVTGQVTAHGTITAEAKGTLTAKREWLSGFLVSGLANTGTGQAVDSRPYQAGYMQSMASGCSASASLLASYDSASWLLLTGWGVAVNGTATAQVTGYYPFIAGRVDNAYNDGGGATAITATVWMHLTRV